MKLFAVLCTAALFVAYTAAKKTYPPPYQTGIFSNYPPPILISPSPPPANGFSTCNVDSAVQLSGMPVNSSSSNIQILAILPDACSAVGNIPTVLANMPIVAFFIAGLDNAANIMSIIYIKVSIGPFDMYVDITGNSLTITFEGGNAYVVSSEEDLKQFLQVQIADKRLRSLLTHDASHRLKRELKGVLDLSTCNVEKALCSVLATSTVKTICFFYSKIINAAKADCLTAVELLFGTGQIEALVLPLAPCAISAGLYAICNALPGTVCVLADIPGCNSSPSPPLPTQRSLVFSSSCSVSNFCRESCQQSNLYVCPANYELDNSEIFYSNPECRCAGTCDAGCGGFSIPISPCLVGIIFCACPMTITVTWNCIYSPP